MRFKSITRDALGRVLAFRLPFVLYIKPNSNEVIFYSDPKSDKTDWNTRSFKVKPWGGASFADEIGLRLNAEQTVEYLSQFEKPQYDNVEPWPQSTELEQYLSTVDDLIDRLRDSGGKTVISRTICAASKVDWISVAEEYFSKHDEAFRYIYFTPKHGFWLGASPELLLRVSDGLFLTMALAGTRPESDKDMPWSGKNIAEQAVVRNYIVDKLYDIGLNPVVGATETVTTGNLQHLRTLINGRTEGIPSEDILTALNPTPALAGYPMPAALENIVESEHHPRRCYGGYVALTDGENVDAFVNLRCVNFDETSWCMYVGGGIMPDSDSNDEWLETENKALLLRTIIENNQI